MVFFLVTLAAGFVVLVPTDLVELAKEMLASLGFVSNIKFWRGADYWFSGVRPLLHTWSLSIEEQFYLFFPLLLAMLSKRGARLTAVVVVALAASSLAVAVLLVDRAPSAAFFLLPTRMWELAVGAILALELLPDIRDSRLRQGAALIGLAMVVFPCFIYDERTAFPGLAALPPCLGTALLIQAGRDGRTAIGDVLSSRMLIGLGLISYSLYLYHYPTLLVARELAGTATLPASWAIGAILLSVVLAFLSWRFVEQPFRRSSSVGRRALFMTAASASVVVALAAVATVAQSGFPGRFTPVQQATIAASDDLDPRFTACVDAPFSTVFHNPACSIGPANGSSRSFVLLGDSHAAAIAPAMDGLASRTSRRGTLISAAACPPLLGLPMTHLAHSARVQCLDRVAREIAAIASDPAITDVILIAYWSAYNRGYGARAPALIPSAILGTAKALPGKRLILLTDLPVARLALPRALVVADRFGLPPPRLELSQPVGLGSVLGELSQLGVRVVSLAPALCPTRRDCPSIIDQQPVLVDSNHLTQSVARRRVAPYLAALHILD